MKTTVLLKFTLLGVLAVLVHGPVPARAQGPEAQEVLIFNGLNEADAPFYMLTHKNEFDLTSYRSLAMDGGQGHRFCYIGG